MSEVCLTADVVCIPLPIPTEFMIGTVNAYLVLGSPLVLIDAGVATEDAYRVLVQHLESNGVAIRDLDFILLTHNHLDHTGLVPRLVEESGATVCAHPMAFEASRRGIDYVLTPEEFRRAIMLELGTPAELVGASVELEKDYQPFRKEFSGTPLEDGDTILAYTAYHVPGHSATDTLFVDHARRFAFTGDHLLKNISPNPLIRRPPRGQARPKSLVEYRQSLLRTRSLELSYCYPGHGGPIEDHRDAIDTLLSRLEKRNEEIIEILGKSALTPYQVAMRLFPEIAPKRLYLALSVSIGHLELLEETGRIIRKDMDGVAGFALLGG